MNEANNWVFAASFTGACLMACAAGGGGSNAGCTTDADCKGSRVCVSNECVTPGTGTDGGTQANTDSGQTNTNCDPVGTTCTTTSLCCQSGTGIGAAGAICISNDNLCHAACTAGAECTSGCCAPVQGQSLGVCAAASACAPTCVQPGGGCTLSTDCCQSGTNVPAGATCLTEDYTCHDICTTSSECTGGCCIALQGLSYGACGVPTGHVCM